MLVGLYISCLKRKWEIIQHITFSLEETSHSNRKTVSIKNGTAKHLIIVFILQILINIVQRQKIIYMCVCVCVLDLCAYFKWLVTFIKNKSLPKTDQKTQSKFNPFYVTAHYKTKRDCCKTQDKFICSQAQITVAKTHHCFARLSLIQAGVWKSH